MPWVATIFLFTLTTDSLEGGLGILDETVRVHEGNETASSVYDGKVLLLRQGMPFDYLHLLYQPQDPSRSSVPSTLLHERQFPTPHASRPLTAAQAVYHVSWA